METGNPNDCAMQITDIKDIDNGEWECSVTGKGPNGDFDIGLGKVQVIANPPGKSYRIVASFNMCY